MFICCMGNMNKQSDNGMVNPTIGLTLSYSF